MEVRTERLHVRDISRDDVVAMTALWMDTTVKEGMGSYGPQTADGVPAWIEDAILHNNAIPRFAHNSAIIELESGKVAGWIGFGRPSKNRVGDIDFGYSLLPDFRGRGYATEALAAVIDFCFSELGVQSVFGETMPPNLGSARVMEKVGLRRAGNSEDGHIIFLITREEFDAGSQHASKTSAPYN